MKRTSAADACPGRRMTYRERHFQVRMLQRYDTAIDRRAMALIRARCAGRRGDLVYSDRWGHEHWAMTWRGHALQVVFDRRHHELVTVLRPFVAAAAAVPARPEAAGAHV